MQLHASCVAFHGNAILIRGTSGSGKSSLALQLMSIGADLVADDRVEVEIGSDGLMASAPKALFELIEARGVGILKVPAVASAIIQVVVDLDKVEDARLPDHRSMEIAGQLIPVLHKVESPSFAAALRQYVLGGRSEV